MSKYVYDPMIKMLVKSKDVEVNGKEADWITKKGQHIAIGEGGEIVAGGIPNTPIGANQSGNNINNKSENKINTKSKEYKYLQKKTNKVKEFLDEIGVDYNEIGIDDDYTIYVGSNEDIPDDVTRELFEGLDGVESVGRNSDGTIWIAFDF